MERDGFMQFINNIEMLTVYAFAKLRLDIELEFVILKYSKYKYIFFVPHHHRCFILLSYKCFYLMR